MNFFRLKDYVKAYVEWDKQMLLEVWMKQKIIPSSSYSSVYCNISCFEKDLKRNQVSFNRNALLVYSILTFTRFQPCFSK